MTPEAFAAERADRLRVADERLAKVVADGLNLYGSGRDNWTEKIVDAAAQIWLENFQAEAPGATYKAAIARFRERTRETLRLTAQPDHAAMPAQIDRVTRWLSTYAVNDGTVGGSYARGIRYKRWVTMEDVHVRASHRPLDGDVQPIGGRFDVAGTKLAYPGEPRGPLDAWIECRCVLMPASREGETMSANTFAITDRDAFAAAPGLLKDGTPPKCAYCDNTATGYVLHSEGMAYVPFDERHREQAIADAEKSMPDGTRDPSNVDAVREYTLGYPERSARAEYDADSVTFDRASPWLDDEHFDYPMGGTVTVAATQAVDSPVDDVDEDLPIGDDAAPEDDIDEVPVHGVLAPEGVETGDGRGFREGALSTRALPVPLRYEVVGSHGGNQTSEVVTVGRIDEAWRDDATKMWRYRGAIIMSKPYADAALQGIIDGSGTGTSIDADAMSLDMSAMTEEAITAAEAEGRNPTQWFSSARVAGLTIVPIPAFPEAYIGLGHDFAEDMTPEDKQAAADALAACGCLDGVDDAYEKAVAENPDLAVPFATGFAPGTHDGPGWITHPRATKRIRDYWVRGKGAAKIRWGVPGDFNRCRLQLAKYVQNPEWLAGLCANMHKEAIKVWPGQEAGGRKRHALLASGGLPAPIMTLVASAEERTVYPAEWFDDPKFEAITPMHIDMETGRVYGHLAQWGVCHIGVAGTCVKPEHSSNGYAYYRRGVVDTDRGEQRVANLTQGIGHADPRMRASAATAHYDDIDAAWAYVNIGEDKFGIWYAGVVTPWASEETIAKVRGIGSVSGDWRRIGAGLELVAAVSVNTPGYPILSLAASGGIQDTLILPGVTASASQVGTDERDPDEIENEKFLARAVIRTMEMIEQKKRATTVRERALALRKNEARRRLKERN